MYRDLVGSTLSVRFDMKCGTVVDQDSDKDCSVYTIARTIRIYFVFTSL